MDYYNEFDPHAAQWIRNLIARGVIPAGDVDERSSPQRSSPAQWTQCLTAETPTELFSMLSEMSRHAG